MQNLPRAQQLAQYDADIRRVISHQIAAFRAESHATAFGLAAPELQDQFGTPEEFVAMVQEFYRPVYRAQNFDFTGPAKALAAHPEMRIQRVFITDDRGTGHQARYIMQKQPDGSWKIAGCQLLGSPQLEI
jgi:hypothetical protein